MDQVDLEVHLLGGFHIQLNGETLTTLIQSRQQSLLAYLILHAGSPQSRQQVAFCFWPDSTEERAYGNLRFTIHQLRRSCPHLVPFLDISQSTMQWRPPASFRLDVTLLEDLVAQAYVTPDVVQACQLLVQASELYRGELLPGCYDDWILPLRERFSHFYLQLLQRLVDQYTEQGEYRSAIDYAQKLQSYDPLSEISYRRLMELYEAASDRAAALHVYHDCLTTLERELGVEPTVETRAVYERILNPGPQQAIPFAPLPPMTTAISAERLVGRHAELRRLQNAWQRASTGQSHMVLIQGEGGIGKTRLAEELLAWAKRQGHLTVRTRAYAAEGQLAYAPLVSWLRTELYQNKIRTIDRIWKIELSRLLPELAGEFPDLPQPAALTSSWQRQRHFEALAHAALSVIQEPTQPLLVLIDDLQWSDQETLEWLPFLLRFSPSAPLLIVGTARMEEVESTHPLATLLKHLRRTEEISEIALTALDAAPSAELAQHVAGHSLDAEILKALYTYAEGVPLILVEAVRAEVGKDANSAGRWNDDRPAASVPVGMPISIPPRVYNVLQARLDQLSPRARRIADLAAVIGRSFAVDLLVKASGAAEVEVVGGLDELWKRRILRERGSDYDISHDRIRDVAYAEISPMQRRMLHRQVAHTLENNHANDLDTVSAQLAWHYEHAGMPKQAIEFYRRAGVASQRIYANKQAIELFAKGLALIEEVPESRERDSQELELHVAMAASVRTKNYLAPEAHHALSRALELGRRLDGRHPNFWLVWGLDLSHMIRADLAQCAELERTMALIAAQEENPLFTFLTNNMIGANAFFVGNFEESRDHFRLATSCYTVEFHEQLVLFTGADSGVNSLVCGGHTLWCLGQADQAISNSLMGLALAQQLTQPINIVQALAYVATLHQFRRELDGVRRQVEAALTIAARYEVNYFGAWAAILHAWTLASAHPGQVEIAALQRAIDDFRVSGAAIRLPYFLHLLAEVYAKANAAGAALATIKEAFEIAAEHNEHWWDAELHRLRGVILLSQDVDLGQVEAEFQQALNIARHQQARALELRAAVSLARLWQKSQREKARHILAAIYCQFSEGFDTLDLCEAKELLAQLS